MAARFPVIMTLSATSGTGTFTQTGGTNSVLWRLYLGYIFGISGTYNLSADGPSSLSAYPEYIGYYGAGSFTQTGGNHTVFSGLYLGYNSGSSGTYDLSGNGLLSAIRSLSAITVRQLHADGRDQFGVLLSFRRNSTGSGNVYPEWRLALRTQRAVGDAVHRQLHADGRNQFGVCHADLGFSSASGNV